MNDDVESLDEGVCDISSDGEHGANDQFADHNVNNKKESNNSCGQLSESNICNQYGEVFSRTR